MFIEFVEFWGRQILGSSSFGVVKFRVRRVWVSLSFRVVEIWGRRVLHSSFGVVEFRGR